MAANSGLCSSVEECSRLSDQLEQRWQQKKEQEAKMSGANVNAMGTGTPVGAAAENGGNGGVAAAAVASRGSFWQSYKWVIFILLFVVLVLLVIYFIWRGSSAKKNVAGESNSGAENGNIAGTDMDAGNSNADDDSRSGNGNSPDEENPGDEGSGSGDGDDTEGADDSTVNAKRGRVAGAALAKDKKKSTSKQQQQQQPPPPRNAVTAGASPATSSAFDMMNRLVQTTPSDFTPPPPASSAAAPSTTNPSSASNPVTVAALVSDCQRALQAQRLQLIAEAQRKFAQQQKAIEEHQNYIQQMRERMSLLEAALTRATEQKKLESLQQTVAARQQQLRTSGAAAAAAAAAGTSAPSTAAGSSGGMSSSRLTSASGSGGSTSGFVSETMPGSISDLVASEVGSATSAFDSMLAAPAPTGSSLPPPSTSTVRPTFFRSATHAPSSLHTPTPTTMMSAGSQYDTALEAEHKQ